MFELLETNSVSNLFTSALGLAHLHAQMSIHRVSSHLVCHYNNNINCLLGCQSRQYFII